MNWGKRYVIYLDDIRQATFLDKKTALDAAKVLPKFHEECLAVVEEEIIFTRPSTVGMNKKCHSPGVRGAGGSCNVCSPFTVLC